MVTVGPGEAVAEHYHPYSQEYLVVVEGELRVDLDGVPRSVAANEALLIPREVRHRVVNASGTVGRAVFFLSPLAPRPDLGHVNTESREDAAAVAQAAVTESGGSSGPGRELVDR
ncbi:cupin domain-containing protein [Streptomyces sp. MI02-7b]|nr:cupin domain-containing protein [Streptomyces sp. MI02-7b]